MKAKRVLTSKVLDAAKKRLPIRNDRELERNLEYAADTKSEAYRIGAEEAQAEIVSRLRKIAESEK